MRVRGQVAHPSQRRAAPHPPLHPLLQRMLLHVLQAPGGRWGRSSLRTLPGEVLLLPTPHWLLPCQPARSFTQPLAGCLRWRMQGQQPVLHRRLQAAPLRCSSLSTCPEHPSFSCHPCCSQLVQRRCRRSRAGQGMAGTPRALCMTLQALHPPCRWMWQPCSAPSPPLHWRSAQQRWMLVLPLLVCGR